jgi:AAHS family 4-hydroxybenzoate transporter-like MFS transporter
MNILLAIAIIMADGFDLQSIGLLAPEIAQEWGVNIALFGPVFGAGLGGTMFGAIAAGPLSSRFGPRATLVLSLLVFGGFTLATAWATDLYELALIRFIVGLGLGATVPIVMALVAQDSPPRWRATLVVATLCGQPLGALLGGALCGHFIPIIGWRFASFLGGILPPVLALIVWWALAPNRHVRRGALDAARVHPLTELFSPSLRSVTTLLWLCVFLNVFFIYIIVNWLPAAVRSSGYSLQMSVLAMGLFNSGGIAGAFVMGVLMDRIGPQRVMPAAFGVAAISMALLDRARPHEVLFFVMSALTGFTGYGGSMAMGALATALYPPALRTTGIGFAMGVGRFGAVVGPLGAGVALTAGLAIGQLFYFAAAAAILATFGLRILTRHAR